MFSLVCFMLLSFSIFVTSTENNTSCEDNASKPKSIFILAGQSNMAGRGGTIAENWAVPPECQPNPQILRLNAELTWEEAREPLHKDIDVGKTCGIGPGMPFANSVLKRGPSIGVIGLVPCAKGATSITEWGPRSFLYNKMLSRAQAALRGGGGQIRALLWYQGESDISVQDKADAYKSKLEELLTQLRYDLQLPTLPVIEVALAARDKNGTFFDVVRRAQLDLETELSYVKCVDAKGLEVNKFDHIHLTTQSEVKLGQKMADVFLQF